MTTGQIVLIGGGVVLLLGVVYVIAQNTGRTEAIALGSQAQRSTESTDAELLGSAVRGLFRGLIEGATSSQRNDSNGQNNNNNQTGGNTATNSSNNSRTTSSSSTSSSNGSNRP